tara:strand:+ start:552 stop:776 length:225 start_codon:yes stop_codon:yes gene_type:complete
MTMKMTRQHFESLADLCSEIMVENNFTKDQCVSIVDSFCDVCRRSNPLFNEETFTERVDKLVRLKAFGEKLQNS